MHAGDLGTVVMLHQGNKGCTVEFTTLSGETIVVATLSADQVRPTRKSDIAHVRELAKATSCLPSALTLGSLYPRKA